MNTDPNMPPMPANELERLEALSDLDVDTAA